MLGMADYKETGRCRSLIVAGCLGQRYGQQLLDEIPEADAIIGTGGVEPYHGGDRGDAQGASSAHRGEG